MIYQVIDIKDALENDGIEIKNLSIDGGMASNDMFCQLLSDYLNQEVSVPSSLESTAIGAAITAGLGANYFSIKELQQSMGNFEVFKPREGIFDPEDLKKWRKFLSDLLEAYK